ncbi:GntR family transcriptional regulator [Bosea sp. (in: a-proteobacteria)]|jgi:DNA-binding GntR family transcriptional regulator|uniref:GntR family transcriptional regulator n=1 Tax=Bosea sp. (in: a-proteobacteria) TaxID=1871050 RepID=UPI002DDD0C05|nr:FCD domain-containing protein [Bosea sp. (in: a-proteobacteria)]HEV2513589.1 FCD domain-containing protein [Bosea sp. (in: a-proteobacteria)]
MSSSDKTLADRTYRQLRGDIVNGRLAAGSKLKLEGLAQDYEVGMSPLREALARLMGDLLVVSEGQRGFWVAPLSLDELDDVSRVRALIEAEALNAAIRNGDAAWEREVTAAFEALAEIEEHLPHTSEALPPGQIEIWEARNRAFHAALVSAAGSPMLIKLRDLLYQQSERYRRVSLNVSRGWRNVHDEHRAIYDATMQRNALRACRMTELHLSRTAEEVRKAMAALARDDDQIFGGKA